MGALCVEQRAPGLSPGELLEGPEGLQAGRLPHTEGDTREVTACERGRHLCPMLLPL